MVRKNEDQREYENYCLEQKKMIHHYEGNTKIDTMPQESQDSIHWEAFTILHEKLNLGVQLLERV